MLGQCVTDQLRGAALPKAMQPLGCVYRQLWPQLRCLLSGIVAAEKMGPTVMSYLIFEQRIDVEGLAGVDILHKHLCK